MQRLVWSFAAALLVACSRRPDTAIVAHGGDSLPVAEADRHVDGRARRRVLDRVFGEVQ
jgi:hypothetical protein